MSQEEAYRILEISHYATMDEIKKAYRTLCKQFHPDKNSSPEALQKYLQVQNAYEWIVKMGWYRTINTFSNSTKVSHTGKIIGNPSLSKQYLDLQIRAAQTRRFKEERKKQLIEREKRYRKEFEQQIKARKLPSEREAEKWEKIALEREAERIAKIIQKFMEL